MKVKKVQLWQNVAITIAKNGLFVNNFDIGRLWAASLAGASSAISLSSFLVISGLLFGYA